MALSKDVNAETQISMIWLAVLYGCESGFLHQEKNIQDVSKTLGQI